ncbi:MAG: FliM/FliN family flagellar motor switch protein [Porticoccaceae bacterium]|nr:FliM/FliN family flagellar motor switch protein [Porticoccaceae bacterium]
MADDSNTSSDSDLGMILNIPVGISAVVGSTQITIREVLAWGPESVVELDSYTDDPLEVCINGISMATAEAVEAGERYGARIVSVASAKERIKSLG